MSSQNCSSINSDSITRSKDARGGNVLLKYGQKQINPDIKNGRGMEITESPKLSPLCASRRIPQSSVFNACYTPSSLFRSANACSTPVRNRFVKKSKVDLTDYNLETDADDRLRVAVRIRPLSSKECLMSSVSNIIKVNKNEITVLIGTRADTSSGVHHVFTYDHVFSSCDPESANYANQKEVFLKIAQPLVVRAFEGYNACLFAYGQTGSGKSYSMMGFDTFDEIGVPKKSIDEVELNQDAGIIPRFGHELFKYMANEKNKFNAEVEVSYFEIYNEKIHDLLCVSNDLESSVNGRHLEADRIKTKKALKVREHPNWGPYVVDLSVHPVDSFEALRNLVVIGNSNRAIASTGSNDNSSRSHCIFNITLKINCIALSNVNVLQHLRRSKVSLVDLAGSERMRGSNGDRIREGVHINKSLLTLGKVISALLDARNNSSIFVPYRESILTWLLRENLGGNSKTVMLATISPANIHVEETLATLRYACQAQRIVNRVKVNESQHDKTIRELKSEVERLKLLQYEYERQKHISANKNCSTTKFIADSSNINEPAVLNLKKQLLEREKELQQSQTLRLGRFKEAEDLRKSDLHLLKRKGLAIELNKAQKYTCLINLTEDPMLNETLFYIIPNGCVKIGRTRSVLSGIRPDITLDGPLVAHNHCVIENINGELFVIPENSDFKTYLNGELVKCKKKMYHGDRLVIGGSHFFRVCNPFCSYSDKKQKLADFHQAYHEVLDTQEEQLRLQLEDEKRMVLSRLETDRIEHERNVKEHMDKIELEQLMLKCNREILESEKINVCEVKIGNQSIGNSVILNDSSVDSKLFKEINSIMQQPSQKSLDKAQAMINEATQYCRNHGLLYEFKQTQLVDEFGMFHTKILIIDKEEKLKMEWPLPRLEVWLESVQEQQHYNAKNIFNCFDVQWTKLDDSVSENVQGVLNNSRINQKVTPTREIIMRPDISKTHRHTKVIDKENVDFETNLKIHINEIQCSTLKLKKLCEIYNNDNRLNYNETSQILSASLKQLEYTLDIMQSCVDKTSYQKEKHLNFITN